MKIIESIPEMREYSQQLKQENKIIASVDTDAELHNGHMALIKIAKENSKNLNLLNRSKFKTFDINSFNVGKYDLIVSNPPYVPFKEIRNLTKDIINFEPIVALNGGKDGLDLIKKVIYKSTKLLKKGGLLALEIGNKQYPKVSDLLNQLGFKEMSKLYDYNRNVRCIISTKVRFF